MKISVLVKTDLVEGVFGEKYFDRLRRNGEVAVYDRENFDDNDYVLEFVKGSDIIITSWGSPAIGEEILGVCPELKGVFHAAGSIKPIMTDALMAKESVRLTASAMAIGEGVAESALAFAIAACKGAFTLSKYTKAGQWGERNAEEVIDFYDIKVGVIGAGFVGRHMIKLLKNFHVDILLSDPTVSQEQAAELGVQKCELDELLAQSDVISVHAPELPSTRHMINKNNINLIKERAIIVNTSRGVIFEESALIEFLKKNKNVFACLDVTEVEPPAPDNELRKLDNVNLTPHIAGTASNGRRRIALHICEETERFFAGEKMRAEVSREMIAKMA